MEKYKKGDYIAVMTNQPDIHFLEMFGHGLSTDNVEPSMAIRIEMLIKSSDQRHASAINLDMYSPMNIKHSYQTRLFLCRTITYNYYGQY